MGHRGRLKDDVRSIALNVAANFIWLLLTIVSATAIVFVTQSSNGHGLSATLTTPTWLVLLFAVVGIATAAYVFVTTRRASVVRGRELATRANFELLASRRKIDPSVRVVRSTRFGRWPPDENLSNRSNFREELNKAILDEEADVRRIWNISSAADVKRLKELLQKYGGYDNHSIRAYFGIAQHVMPELLVVDQCGASISFVSTKTPHRLDWAIHVKRPDLMNVIRDYFDVLWDRAERILDSGEVTAEGQAALKTFEASLTTLQQP